MTREICSHHFWFVIYGIVNTGLLYLIISAGIIFATHDWKEPPPSTPTDQFEIWYKAVFQFDVGLVIFGITNLMGFLFMNGRYKWFALKDCSRIK